MKPLLTLVILSIALSGCKTQSHEDYEKSRARWDTWSLAARSERIDERIQTCIRTLKSVEEQRTELTEKIDNTNLAPAVREDLKVQRGLAFHVGQRAIAELTAMNSQLERQLEWCEQAIKQTNLDPVADAHCFERVSEARTKIALLKTRTKAITEAWQGYAEGKPLGDLK